MESIEKLRQAIGSPELTYKGERVGYSWYAQNILEHVDAVEREIAERYMLLPVDADGVPIRVGDEVMYGVGQAAHYVFAVSENAAWLNNSSHPPLVFLQEFASEQCHHVKPRTIEDVLEEFAARVLNSGHQCGLDAEKTVAEYADELRWLGVDDR